MSDPCLTVTSPESLGIPSQAILEFLEELKAHRFPMHSVLLLRHGKIAAEHYCPPFDENRKHRMYSVSKSFTAVAVGMLIDEGRLSLEDKVADFFPEYIPRNAVYCREATVRHLLMMATFNEGTTYTFESPDYVRAFFDNNHIAHKPGTIFHYDTAGTVTLCAIVEKITGKPMLEYMRPLFDELGISKDVWCVQTPEGRSWTGSGILCTPRDLARFGLFCLNRGQWNGRQLVSRAYMEAATSYQIDTSVAHSGIHWPAGYGYQFWMLRDGGFACCGMGSQFAFMMPKYDALLVTTADTQGLSNADDVIRFAYYRLLEKTQEAPLPENPAALQALRDFRLALPLPTGKTESPLAEKISGVRYNLDENDYGFRWIRLDARDGRFEFTYEKRGEVLSFPLSVGRFEEFRFPEPYFGVRMGTRERNYRCVSACAWQQENSLLATVFAVDDYVGTLKMQFTFVDDTVTVFMTKYAEAFFDDYRGYLCGRAEKN